MRNPWYEFVLLNGQWSATHPRSVVRVLTDLDDDIVLFRLGMCQDIQWLSRLGSRLDRLVRLLYRDGNGTNLFYQGMTGRQQDVSLCCLLGRCGDVYAGSPVVRSIIAQEVSVAVVPKEWPVLSRLRTAQEQVN